MGKLCLEQVAVTEQRFRLFHGRGAWDAHGCRGKSHGAGYAPDYTTAEKNTDQIDFLVNMSASADVLAQAKVEVGLESIPEGKNVREPTLYISITMGGC